MIPAESLPLGLHARDFVSGVQLSNQRHSRPPSGSQPRAAFASLFNESATCMSYLGRHPEACAALASGAATQKPAPLLPAVPAVFA